MLLSSFLLIFSERENRRLFFQSNLPIFFLRSIVFPFFTHFLIFPKLSFSSFYCRRRLIVKSKNLLAHPAGYFFPEYSRSLLGVPLACTVHCTTKCMYALLLQMAKLRTGLDYVISHYRIRHGNISAFAKRNLICVRYSTLPVYRYIVIQTSQIV